MADNHFMVKRKLKMEEEIAAVRKEAAKSVLTNVRLRKEEDR